MISEWERQARLLYSIIVAGKSANFADNAVTKLIGNSNELPFDQIAAWVKDESIAQRLRDARVGNYTKIEKSFRGIHQAFSSNSLDLKTCAPQDLESIHGIGPKTSRFFIMWTRPEEVYAALDVHVLRWLRNLGYDAPKATPSSKKKYSELEVAFIKEASKRGMTPRELDEQIWVEGSGRTQENTTAEAHYLP